MEVTASHLTPRENSHFRLYELDWGYLRKGALHAIVTSGYGFWGPPIRIGSRAEIVRIEATFGTGDAQE